MLVYCIMNATTKKHERKFAKKRESSFYIYGINPVIEVLKAKPGDVLEVFLDELSHNNIRIKNVMRLARMARVPVKRMSLRYIEKFAIADSNTQGVVAKLKGFAYLNFDEWKKTVMSNGDKCKLVLVLDRIEDPGNFGAIVRSACAAGASGIFVANARQVPVNATVFKTSAGTVAKAPVIQVSNLVDTLGKLKKMGFWIYGIDMDNTSNNNATNQNIWDCDFDNMSVLVLGSEGSGISELVKRNCDFVAHIPMENGVESLNVAVSAAIAVYEWKRIWNKHCFNMLQHDMKR